MNTLKLKKTLVGLALLSVCAVANAQIANTSFETGTAYTGSPNIFVSGTPAPWYATSWTPDCYDNSGADGWNLGGITPYGGMFKGMLAHSGHRFLGFAAGPGFVPEAFKQNISPLTAGQKYTISAWIAAEDTGKAAASFGGPYTGRGEVDVRVNGVSVGLLTQNTTSMNWEQRSVTFVAPTASSYDVEFVAMFDPTGQSAYIGIDDAEMTVVPEPASIGALGVGIAALVRKRLRRK